MRKVLTLLTATVSIICLTGSLALAKADHDKKPKKKPVQKYSWQIGAWGACSATKCGTHGTQKRSVKCVNSNGATVGDRKCSSPKPATKQPCQAPACAPPTTTTTLPHPPTTTTLPRPTTTTTLPHPTTTTTVPHPTTTTTMPPVTTTLPPTTTTTLPSGGGATDYFPSNSIWYKDVSAAAKHVDSDSIISWLTANGGWGAGAMKVDLSMNILKMDATTPMKNLVESQDYYSPDCSDNLKTFPAPVGGAIEGNSGYTCADDGDCHLLVLDKANKKLYESYQTNVSGNNLTSTCAIVWDLNKTYGPNLRGEQCTSTDAAGFPVAALLVTADEVASGSVNHAMRFILPNARMQKGVYLHPATHAGGPSGPATAVPYGAHFRLKASYDISKLKPAAQVIAKAMKKYGMFLADGGNIALTFANDQFTTAKWSQLGFGTQDLTSLKTSDFEMVQEYDGQRINLNYNCVRNP